VAGALILVAVGCAGTIYFRNRAETSAAVAAQSTLRNHLTEQWATPAPAVKTPTAKHAKYPIVTPAKAAPVAAGGAYALMSIPRLGKHWSYVVVEGGTGVESTLAALRQGPAHLAGTQGPGEVGNFAIAGHRWGSWGMFFNLPDMVAGDVITVETARDVYTYKVTGTETVLPANSSVIAPVADHPDQAATKATITLITCVPLYISSHRLAVHGELVSDVKKSGH